MNFIKNFLFNLIMELLPISHFFRLKILVAKFFGIHVTTTTRLSHKIKIFGGGQIYIGKNTWVGIDVRFYIPVGASIWVGNYCDIAPDVIFQTGTHDIGLSTRRAGKGNIGSIKVGDGTWIGVRALILPGAIIGSGCIVAGGSVVTAGEYPDNTLLAGIPAKIIKHLSED